MKISPLRADGLLPAKERVQGERRKLTSEGWMEFSGLMKISGLVLQIIAHVHGVPMDIYKHSPYTILCLMT
jgi:hypothetical protein